MWWQCPLHTHKNTIATFMVDLLNVPWVRIPVILPSVILPLYYINHIDNIMQPDDGDSLKVIKSGEQHSM